MIGRSHPAISLSCPAPNLHLPIHPHRPCHVSGTVWGWTTKIRKTPTFHQRGVAGRAVKSWQFQVLNVHGSKCMIQSKKLVFYKASHSTSDQTPDSSQVGVAFLFAQTYSNQRAWCRQRLQVWKRTLENIQRNFPKPFILFLCLCFVDDLGSAACISFTVSHFVLKLPSSFVSVGFQDLPIGKCALIMSQLRMASFRPGEQSPRWNVGVVELLVDAAVVRMFMDVHIPWNADVNFSFCFRGP